MDLQKKQKLKASIACGVIALFVLVVVIMMIRYSVEGDKNMPFTLSKIMLISSAEGIVKEETTADTDVSWNLDVMQNNDIYFQIDRVGENAEENYIKNVLISNIEIVDTSEKSNIKMYMPNSLEGRTFVFSENYEFQRKLEFKGGTKTDLKSLQIGNQGGTIGFRIANVNIGEYISTQDAEIKHDGSLLNVVGLTTDQVKFDVRFDFIIETSNAKYKSEIILTLPCGDVVSEGISKMEINALEDIIFKRVSN